MSDPKFEDIDFHEISEMLRVENLCRLTAEDVRVTYIEIVNLKYNANNFCQYIPASNSGRCNNARTVEAVEEDDEE